LTPPNATIGVERSARSVDVRLDDRQVRPEPRQKQRQEIRMLHDLVRNSIVTAPNSRTISPSGKWVMAGWRGPTPLEQQPRDVVILEGRQADEQLPGVLAPSDDPAAYGSARRCRAATRSSSTLPPSRHVRARRV
jgi:hypothetical protein